MNTRTAYTSGHASEARLGYAQGIAIDDRIVISGQVDRRHDAATEDNASQVRSALTAIDDVATALDPGADVVSLRAFVTADGDIDATREMLSDDRPAAVNVTAVSRLVTPAARVEITAEATVADWAGASSQRIMFEPTTAAQRRYPVAAVVVGSRLLTSSLYGAEDGDAAGDEGIDVEFDRAVTVLKQILARAGFDLRDVVLTEVFLDDKCDEIDVERVIDAHRRHFALAPPTSTFGFAPRFAVHGARLQLRAEAARDFSGATTTDQPFTTRSTNP